MADRSFIRVTADDAVPQGLRHGVVAIGNFDGVHLGHRAVLDMALARAHEMGVPALALTFEPHPRQFFRPEIPFFRLTPAAEKARLLAEAGFSGVIEKSFTQQFSAMPASSFVYRLLGQELRARHVVAGRDFHFGKDRFGTPQFLMDRAAEMKVGVSLVDLVRDASGEPVSSSRIRNALSAGDIATANRLLGRPWRVSGEIVNGRQIGRTLGYPTANMELPAGTGLRHGIYAVRVIRATGARHDGVASYGRRPTFDDGAPLFETFLFDFSGNLYGEFMAVEFHSFLRGEEKFDSVDALVAQMNRDAEEARRLLSGIAA
jgi:riboflavin kinase/FMN adenylyltransferase